MPRFTIRKKGAPSAPWVLIDRARPAFTFPTPTHTRAVRAMDNIVRRERGLAPRIEWPTEEHVGQHIQGCVSCYVYNDAKATS
jgi:hypothetical protein